MLKVGLTGGIGSGKSTAVNAFRELGVAIVDADKIAREVLKPQSEGHQEIVAEFGQDVLQENGELNRAKLKEIVFEESDAGTKALEQLEQITHPKIKKMIHAQMEKVSQSPDHPYLLVDIPLLVEKNYQTLFDRIVVVDCSVEQQIERVQERDDLDLNTITKIIEQQATRQERKENATDILDNSQDVEYLLNQIKKLHKKFVSLSSVYL